MSNIYEMTDTWNNGAVAFTAIGMNVTDTASDAASLLMDLKVGGVSKFSVGKGAGAVFSANLLEQRNSTNAQTYNIYNTYTDASNYERGFMRWNSNVLEIGTEAAGTGSNRAIRLGVGTARKIEISTIGGWQLYNGSTREGYYNWDALTVRSDSYIGFASSTSVGAGQGDTNLIRVGAGIVGVRANNTTTGGALNLIEQTAPSAPAANQVVIYAEDDGAGKTRLMALFPTGAAQQIAIEP